LCSKISEHLTGEEFGEPVYKKLFDTIKEARQKGKIPAPADLLGTFETDDERKMVNKVLFQSQNYDETKQAIAQQVTFLRDNYISEQIAQTTDILKMQELIKEQKAIKQQKISF